MNKEKGKSNSNGKEQDTCKSICTSIAADEQIAEVSPQPLSKHSLRVQRDGHKVTGAKLDVKAELWYGKCPNFTHQDAEL